MADTTDDTHMEDAPETEQTDTAMVEPVAVSAESLPTTIPTASPGTDSGDEEEEEESSGVVPDVSVNVTAPTESVQSTSAPPRTSSAVSSPAQSPSPTQGGAPFSHQINSLATPAATIIATSRSSSPAKPGAGTPSTGALTPTSSASAAAIPAGTVFRPGMHMGMAGTMAPTMAQPMHSMFPGHMPMGGLLPSQLALSHAMAAQHSHQQHAAAQAHAHNMQPFGYSHAAMVDQAHVASQTHAAQHAAQVHAQTHGAAGSAQQGAFPMYMMHNTMSGGMTAHPHLNMGNAMGMPHLAALGPLGHMGQHSLPAHPVTGAVHAGVLQHGMQHHATYSQFPMQHHMAQTAHPHGMTSAAMMQNLQAQQHMNMNDPRYLQSRIAQQQAQQQRAMGVNMQHPLHYLMSTDEAAAQQAVQQAGQRAEMAAQSSVSTSPPAGVEPGSGPPSGGKDKSGVISKDKKFRKDRPEGDDTQMDDETVKTEDGNNKKQRIAGKKRKVNPGEHEEGTQGEGTNTTATTGAAAGSTAASQAKKKARKESVAPSQQGTGGTTTAPSTSATSPALQPAKAGPGRPPGKKPFTTNPTATQSTPSTPANNNISSTPNPKRPPTVSKPKPSVTPAGVPLRASARLVSTDEGGVPAGPAAPPPPPQGGQLDRQNAALRAQFPSLNTTRKKANERGPTAGNKRKLVFFKLKPMEIKPTMMNLMKRLILNRRIGELQAERLRARRIALIGLPAVEQQEYEMLDQLYNGPPVQVVPRITAKMKQQERKRLAHQAQLAREKAEREARLQAMDEASRAAAQAEEEERLRKKEAKEAEKAARKLERAAQKRQRRAGSDDDDDDTPQEKKRKANLTPAENEAYLRSQLEELTESLQKQNTEKVQLFEALKHVLNREQKKLKALAAENQKTEAAPTPQMKPAPTGASMLTAAALPPGASQKPRMGLSLSLDKRPNLMMAKKR